MAASAYDEARVSALTSATQGRVRVVLTKYQKVPKPHPYIAYIFTVEVGSVAPWLLTRRYSDFFQLRKTLAMAGIRFPGFPEKKNLSSIIANLAPNVEDPLVRQRKIALQDWMDKLVAHPTALTHSEVQRFLTADVFGKLEDVPRPPRFNRFLSSFEHMNPPEFEGAGSPRLVGASGSPDQPAGTTVARTMPGETLAAMHDGYMQCSPELAEVMFESLFSSCASPAAFVQHFAAFVAARHDVFPSVVAGAAADLARAAAASDRTPSQPVPRLPLPSNAVPRVLARASDLERELAGLTSLLKQLHSDPQPEQLQPGHLQRQNPGHQGQQQQPQQQQQQQQQQQEQQQTGHQQQQPQHPQDQAHAQKQVQLPHVALGDTPTMASVRESRTSGAPVGSHASPTVDPRAPMLDANGAALSPALQQYMATQQQLQMLQQMQMQMQQQQQMQQQADVARTPVSLADSVTSTSAASGSERSFPELASSPSDAAFLASASSSAPK